MYLNPHCWEQLWKSFEGSFLSIFSSPICLSSYWCYFLLSQEIITLIFCTFCIQSNLSTMAHLGDRRTWPLQRGGRYGEACRNCNITFFCCWREHNMFTVLCSCSLSPNDNGNPVIYNIKYSDRNIHQKIEKNFE